MRFLKSGFFHESIVPILPRFTPLNIFENIFVFAEIFTKVVFFSKQLPGNSTRKLYNIQVLFLGNLSISE